MSKYSYIKESVDESLLSIQIMATQSIASTLKSVCSKGSNLDIYFMSNLSQDEQDILADIVTAHNASQGGQYQAVHKKETYSSAKLSKEEWFETCDAQGNLSGLSKSCDYTWSGSKMLTRTDKEYFKGGVVREQHLYNYLTVSGNRVEWKVS